MLSMDDATPTLVGHVNQTMTSELLIVLKDKFKEYSVTNFWAINPYTSKGKDMAVKITKKEPGHEFDDHLTPPPLSLSWETIEQAAVKTVAKHMIGKATGHASSKIKSGASDYMEASSEQMDNVMETGFIPAHKLCTVHVNGSRTVNLGNYESAKIDVGITMPTTKDDLVSAYEFASDWVSEKIKEVTDSMKGK